MRRALLLRSDFADLVEGIGIGNVTSSGDALRERLNIERQANMMHVTNRQKIEEMLEKEEKRRKLGGGGNTASNDWARQSSDPNASPSYSPLSRFSSSPSNNISGNNNNKADLSLLSQQAIDERVRAMADAHEQAAQRSRMRFLKRGAGSSGNFGGVKEGAAVVTTGQYNGGFIYAAQTPSSADGASASPTMVIDLDAMIEAERLEDERKAAAAAANNGQGEMAQTYEGIAGAEDFDDDEDAFLNEQMLAAIQAHTTRIAPPNWERPVNGWVLIPDATVPVWPSDGNASSSSSYQPPMVVRKTYCFLDQPQTYKFLGMIGAAIEELGFPKNVGAGDGGEAEESTTSAASASSPAATTTPRREKESPQEKIDRLKEEEAARVEAVIARLTPTNAHLQHPLYSTPVVEWMWSEITVTMLSTPQTYQLAQYLNDLEVRFGKLRNQTRQEGMAPSGVRWSPELQRKIEDRASMGFLWMFNNDKNGIYRYMQSLFMQWSNRADYLIARKSRERKEFRPHLTLTEAMKEGAERKRRTERRKFKDRLATQGATALGMEKEDFERYSFDTIPRDVREKMMEDHSKVGGAPEVSRRFGTNSAFSRSSQW